MEKFYITTPVYYVNDRPHIGHAYTTILADVFARFNRLIGNDVFSLTGTDEHGEKVEKTALERSKSTIEHADEMAEYFKVAWKRLNISNDDFIRTTDSRHKTVVHNIIKKLLKSGDIFKDSYEGWYCIPCESFWKSDQLEDNKCPDCQREVKKLKEENYFFNLSKYQEWLIDYIKKNPEFVLPAGKCKEILSFLERPLENLCISRPKSRLKWGIEFPNDPEFVIYVWFDALINYISAIGYSINEKTFSTYWPADIQIIGKDILRQHAIYWPIMLKAIGIDMPSHIIAHGWWTISGSKVSKSKGNVIDPINMSDIYGTDTFRYYMIREASLGSDGAYSEELLIERFNSDLANDLGNLIHRSLSMLKKYYSGIVPVYNGKYCWNVQSEAKKLVNILEIKMLKDLDPRGAINEIWKLISLANKFIEEVKPWKLNKDSSCREELADFIYTLLETIRIIAVALAAFLPETSEKILTLLSQKTINKENLSTWGILESGITLELGEPLFPKIENE